MNTYFVIWGDYDGDHSQTFKTLDEALEYIAKIENDAHTDGGGTGFRLIEGKELQVEPYEVATKWRVKR